MKAGLFLIAASAAIVAGGFAAPPDAWAQTDGMERRGERRDTRDDAREDKRECKAGDEDTRAECRQGKRDDKQDARGPDDDDKAEPEADLAETEG